MKSRFLFALLMAMVMMAMSPQKMWGVVTITYYGAEGGTYTIQGPYVDVTATSNDFGASANTMDGATITLTPTPDAGGCFSHFTLMDTNTGSDVPLSQNGNSYTFTIPDDCTCVIIRATFNVSRAITTDAQNCSVTLKDNAGNDITAAANGTTVWITATPDDGYDVVSMSIKGNNSVSPYSWSSTDPQNPNRRSFTMPSEPVSITVTTQYHTHGYTSAPTWSWADDGSEATATFTCSCGNQVQLDTKSTPAVEISVNTTATCTSAGTTTYNASVKYNSQTWNAPAKEVATPALGHSYGVDLTCENCSATLCTHNAAGTCATCGCTVVMIESVAQMNFDTMTGQTTFTFPTSYSQGAVTAQFTSNAGDPSGGYITSNGPLKISVPTGYLIDRVDLNSNRPYSYSTCLTPSSGYANETSDESRAVTFYDINATEVYISNTGNVGGIQTNRFYVAYKEDAQTVTCEHELTPHLETSSTCTEQGNTAYWSCSKCGNNFSDAEGKTPIAPNSWLKPIDKNNHPGYNYTSQNNGNHLKKCTACLANVGTECCTWGAWTSTGAGKHYHSCTKCGYSSTPELCNCHYDHDDSYHWEVCSTCSATYPKMPHSWGEYRQTAAPTCVATGTETATCVCSATNDRDIPATGIHTYENGVCTMCNGLLYLAPTYKEEGDPTSGIDSWSTATVESATKVTSSTETVTWGTAESDSWYYVLDNDVTLTQGAVCQGAVHLILCDGAKLTVTNSNDDQAGISVGGTNSLTIYAQSEGASMGTMEITGIDYAAGIGGDEEGNGSNITINGGKVTANGGENAAGIGGGIGYSEDSNNGNGSNITINGGTVTATGGDNAAGIGGGNGNSEGSNNGCGSNITINGGTVTTTGVNYGAGIGGGMAGSCSDISITGGMVIATGGEGAAGIGSVLGISGSNITISTALLTLAGQSADETFDIPNGDVAEELGGLRYVAVIPHSITRTMPNEWGTLVLPFELNYIGDADDSNFRLYYLTSVSSTELTVKEYESGTIPSGTPMLVRATGQRDQDGKFTFTLESNGISDTYSTTITKTTAVDGLSMNGTFSQTTIGGNTDETKNPFFIAGNQFWRADAATTVAPLRAWFEPSSPIDAGASFRIVVADETDGVAKVRSDETGVSSSYDLMGRHISEGRKGLLVRDGRVIMVK